MSSTNERSGRRLLLSNIITRRYIRTKEGRGAPAGDTLAKKKKTKNYMTGSKIKKDI